MDLRSVCESIGISVMRFGYARTLYDLFFRAVNRVVFFKALKVLEYRTVDPRYLQSDPRFVWKFLTQPELAELCKVPEYDISKKFVEDALARGDECYAALDGDVLVGYGWYSNKPTDTRYGLTVHFNPQYIYVYKQFTNPAYRGQHLHSIGTVRALQSYLDRGFKGFVSIIESHNFSSLRSARRAGSAQFGFVGLLKIGRRILMYTSPGCAELGFSLAPSRPAAKSKARFQQDAGRQEVSATADSGESHDRELVESHS